MAKTEKNIIITAEVKQGEIINNFSAIKAQVEAKIAPFVGLVFRDDDIRDAKGTLADLRKMRTVIEDKRKAVKKQWNEPYDAFEKEVKQITEIIDRPIMEIDAQIKDFEERRKQAKREECDAIIDLLLDAIENDGDRDFVKACTIVFDERWLNATTAITQVEKDVKAQIDKILADAKTITEVCEADDMLTDLLVEYQSSKDLSAVLMRRKRMVEQKEAAARLAETRKAEQEARRAQQEAQEAKQAEEPKERTWLNPEVKTELPQAEPEAQASPNPSIAFAVEGPVDALKALVAYLKASKDLEVRRLYRHTAHGFVHWEEEE
jgi:hypothetical protein